LRVVREAQAWLRPVEGEELAGAGSGDVSGFHVPTAPADVGDERVGDSGVAHPILSRPERRDSTGKNRCDADATVGLHAERIEIAETRIGANENAGRESFDFPAPARTRERQSPKGTRVGL